MQEVAAGQIVRKHRKAANLSQQALATRAGIATRTLVNIEGGKDCSLSTLRKLSEALGEPLVVLIGEPALREAHGLCPECEYPRFGPCEHRPEAVA